MKNYIFILLGLLYFLLYFIFKQDTFIVENIYTIRYSREIISYFNSLIGIFLSLGIIGILAIHLEKILTKLFSKTKNKYDDIIGKFIIKFIAVIKYILAIYIGIQSAIIPTFLELIIDKIFNISFILAVLLIINSFLNSILKTILKNKDLTPLSKQLFPIFNKVLLVILWILGCITIISSLGYDIKALVAGAGIGGLAIALAAQKTVSNVFGAVSIIINKPFKIGDFININGHIGLVKDIGLTYLTLRDKSGHDVFVPNDLIISTSIDNYSVRDFRMTDLAFGLVYETSLENMKKAIKITEDILQKYVDDKTIDNYRVIFDNFGDFSLNLNVTYFSLVNDDYTMYLKQKEEINLEVKKQFAKSKIDMAFPTQELIIKK